jgi:putative zinc finger protein
MNDEPTPDTHPEEILAAYADGTASLKERMEAEIHLATCQTCRDEVDLARSARAALVSLPALDPPDVAGQVLAALERAAAIQRAVAEEAAEAAALDAAAAPPASPPRAGPPVSPRPDEADAGARKRAAVGPGAGAGGTGPPTAPGKTGPGATRPEDHDRGPADVRPTAPSRTPSRRAESRRGRLAWAAGGVLAAAAVIAGLFVFVGNQTPGGGSSVGAPGGGGARAPEQASSGGRYTKASIDALARRLATNTRSTLASSPTGAPSDGASTSVSPSPHPNLAASLVPEADSCLRRAAGLEDSARRNLLQAASFNGNPAWVGAFVLPGSGSGRAHLLVLVAARDDCEFLYSVLQSL